MKSFRSVVIPVLDEITKLDYTLGVLKRQRQKLWDDCLKGDYELMHELRRESSEIRKLYYERYRLMWIDTHWNEITDFSSERMLSARDKNAMYLYFADSFKPFVEQLSSLGGDYTEYLSSLLKNQIRSIDALLDMVDHMEERMNELRNLHEVDRIQFDKKIRQLKESEEMKNGSK